MGYADAMNSERNTAAQAPVNVLNVATKRVEADTAALDRVLANPKASVKQITRAMDKLNASTDAQIKAIMSELNKPQTTTTTNNQPPDIGPTNTFGPALIDPEPMTPATTPTTAAPVAVQPPPPPVKTAPIDTVLFDDEGTPIEVMTDLIFENIGGHELINIARNDIVNGQQVSYQPIKNLSSIQQQYNPNNILSLQSTSDKYFANFSIKLENKIPQPGTGPNGAHVYLDNNTGNMIIEAINLEIDEQIEVEITTSGTIYEAEFGEITS
jgi:hypothetical protein